MEVSEIRALIRFSDDKMQKVPLFESERCFCDVYCLGPGQEQRIHRHEGSEKIYYVIEGTGTFHIAGEERRLSAGAAVIARAGEDHGVRNREAAGLVLLVFMCPKP